MIKKITVKWLRIIGACEEGIDAFSAQGETDPIKVMRILICQRPDWANWLIVRLMDYKQYVAYAIYAAEQVIGIYEEMYPDDYRPRKAIEAAKKCLKNQADKNKADAAAYSAAAAVTYSASAAYSAAYSAADDAASAAARKKMQVKILKYGMKLLGGGDNCL